MKVWGAVFNFVATFFLILLAITYINEAKVIQRDFDQERLNYAVKQSTEAMFRKTLKAEDIDLDYTDLAYVSIDSSDAIEVFDRVMCANYDMAPSVENFGVINDSLSVCVLASFSGYYVARYSEANYYTNGDPRDGYKLRFSAKNPYIFEANNTIYAIDTYKKTYSSMNTTQPDQVPSLYTLGQMLPPGISEEAVKIGVNAQLKNAILNELSSSGNTKVASLEGFRLYFPDEKTVTGVNPFNVPGIFVVMQNAAYASQYKIDAFAAAGYRVVKNVNVIAFTDTTTGRAYYCYESQLLDEEKDAASGGIAVGGVAGKYRIDNYFSDIQAACEAVSPDGQHYAPYYDIMVRKVTKIGA